MGNNWVKGTTRLVVIDTCTVQLSTVLLDSVATSGGSHILVGASRSELFGASRLTPYLTFKRGAFTLAADPADRLPIRFDSLTLMLPYAPVYYGDTTRRMTLGLHRLSEEVELDENGALYAHSRFPYEPEPLATVSFLPRPASGRTLEVRLPDALGADILDKFESGAPEVESDVEFREWFNGLVLQPGAGCEAQIGFAGSSQDTLCQMRLYYTETGINPIGRTVDFPLDRSVLFHSVETDRTGTPYAGLTHDNPVLSSAQTNHTALFHSLSGTYPLIEFPYLNGIRTLSQFDHVAEARLVLYPLAGSFDGATYVQLPDSMRLRSISAIDPPSAYPPGSGTLRGYLSRDLQYPRNTNYSYDITTYISGQLGLPLNQRQHLQLMGLNFGSLPESLLLDAQQNGDRHAELHITYSLYNE